MGYCFHTGLGLDPWSRDSAGPFYRTTCQVAKLAPWLASLSRPIDMATGKKRFRLRMCYNDHGPRPMNKLCQKPQGETRA